MEKSAHDRVKDFYTLQKVKSADTPISAFYQCISQCFNDIYTNHFSCSIFPLCIAVSYTHLDVYKRQIIYPHGVYVNGVWGK